MEFIVVLITASHEEEAAQIAHALVNEGLAACVNIVKSLRSIYSWEGTVEDTHEVLMMAKTRGELFGRLQDRVLELHSNSVPEVIALPIVSGSMPYLNWITSETKQNNP